MLIILCGPSFVGKRTVAKFLQEKENFKILQLVETENESDDVIPDKSSLDFSTVDEIEHFLMTEKRWISNWVLLASLSVDQFTQLYQRPFVFTVAIDAPLKLRCQRAIPPRTTVEEVLGLDAEKFPPSALAEIMMHADMTFINDGENVVALHSALSKLELGDQERIRPSWDTYFMKLCTWTAHRSNCMKRKVGAILTVDHRILATGYNGTPFRTLNCNAGGCPRCNQNARAGTLLDTCFCLHAEENALVGFDARYSLGRPLTLYCTMFPCIQCAKKIVQCNVTRLVYQRTYAPLDAVILEYLKESGVLVQVYMENKKVVFASQMSKEEVKSIEN